MEKLSTDSIVYNPQAVAQFENQHILSWYPSRVMARIKDSKSKSLLDLGLGRGYSTPYFNEHFATHLVVEGSAKVIENFNKNNLLSNIEIIEDYFETFNTDQKFDVIMMGFILEHVEDPVAILNKYKNMLKANGQIFITVPNAKSLNRRIGLAMGKISDIYSLNANDISAGHKRNYCLDTLLNDIHLSGCELIYKEGIYLKPLPLSYMQNMPEFEENLQAMFEVGIDFPELCVALLVEIINK